MWLTPPAEVNAIVEASPMVGLRPYIDVTHTAFEFEHSPEGAFFIRRILIYP